MELGLRLRRFHLKRDSNSGPLYQQASANRALVELQWLEYLRNRKYVRDRDLMRSGGIIGI